MSEARVSIILETTRARAEVGRLTEAIDAQRRIIRRADEDYSRGYISKGRMEADTRAAAKGIARLNQDLERNQKTLDRHGDGIRRSGRGANNAGLGFLYLSQAIEDAQYGFHAIVNNIPGIVMALGGGPGLAGAASVAAVAVNQLASNWGRMEMILRGTPLQGVTAGGLAGGAQSFVTDVSTWFYRNVLGIDVRPGDHLRMDRFHKQMAEIQKLRDEAIAKVAGIAAGGGEAELGKAVGGAFGASKSGGKGLLDLLLTRAGFTVDPQAGEDADAAKRREQVRGNIARIIEGALKGIPADVDALLARARGTEFGEKLAELLLPAREDAMRRKATEFLTRFARTFGDVAQQLNFTLPNVTERAAAQMGGQFQAQMEGAGVDPALQARVAKLFTGKGAMGRLRALNIIIPILRQQGATQREVYEALPRIFAYIEAGENPFHATQRAMNDLYAGGLGAFIQGNSQTIAQQQALGGLAQLGLFPTAAPGQTSRFQWPGGPGQPGPPAPPPAEADMMAPVAAQVQENQLGIQQNQAALAGRVQALEAQAAAVRQNNRAIGHQLRQTGRSALNRGR